MSRIYRPTGPRTVMQEQLPGADLIREVRDIERRRVLIDLRDAVDRISTSEPSRSLSYGDVDRSASEFKADVLTALRRLEADQ